MVRIEAAAVNFPDILVMADQYQVSVPVPFIPGSEFAGIVEELGAGATGLDIGQRVMGSAMAGAFAEYVSTPVATLTAVPAGIDAQLAAAFGVAYFTAGHALLGPAALRAGEWVAVLGAAGGVGLATVQVAVALGAKVVALASSEAKLAACRAAGAVATIDYSREDLKVRLKEVTDGGADVVIDPVGGPYAEQALRAMRFGGRFVVVGFASGEIPRIPLNLVLHKGVSVVGFEMGSYVVRLADRAREEQERLLEMLADGRLRPTIDAVYPLSRIAEALVHVGDRRVIGKVVVDVSR